ncbi:MULTISPECIES: gp436 family protein [unclassified Sphingomonas]|uniref:gp436 family protein n=1 Tax=unclassified Sphingomonas TaxID=196159 RepID=UPI000837A033|nr:MULTISPECIES: DUF1320 domain-containing protein [unclassified Sphingomonas]
MYATLADMLARFEESELVQVVDAADLADPVLATRVDAAILRAGTLINAHVAAKYRTGTDPVPPLLTEIACDLARHALYRSAPPETVVDRRDKAMALLKDIAKGVIKLDAGEEALPERPGAILVERPDRLFGRDRLSGY